MMSNTFKIREAAVGDAAQIGAIARAAYAKYVSRIGRDPAPMFADYSQLIAESSCIVLEVRGQVIGYMAAWAEADAYFIENIAVDPAFQRKGLGRRLIDHAAAEAQRLRLPALRLYTNAMMVENFAMYQHLGFVETHRTVEDGYHRVYMRRGL